MTDDLRQYFATEARELIEGLTQGALHVERTGALTAEQRKHLLRLAHTLKGAARIVRETTIADAAHAIEDLIAAAPEAIGSAVASRFLGLIDIITAALGTDDNREAASAATPAPSAAVDDPARAVRVDLSTINGALDQVAHIGSRLATVFAELDAVRKDLPAAARHMVGAIEALTADVSELRAHLHEMRLAPVSAVFVALERAARDAAQAGAVRVRFEATGGEHRIDADVLTSIRDALIQLVRNAIAHGIEPPASRVAAGKPAEGVVHLNVERRGADVAFTVSDDGRGLDLEALRMAASRAGVTRGTSGTHLTERELVSLLLEGGLTSRGTVSQISGRGVGLDLVRAVVTRLGGHLALDNKRNAGVSVVMILPVSLRSLAYVRLESRAGDALMPLDAVGGTYRLSSSSLMDVNGRPHLVVDRKPVAIVSLETILTGAQQAGSRAADGVAVLATAGDRVTAVSAERFGETGITIAQALPPLSAAALTIRGVAVDETARVVPVLEPSAISVMARTLELTVAPLPKRMPRLLVIDDSITTRMLEQSILESAGFEVHTADSAEEALTRTASISYDLFIVDVEMPGMNGFEFVAATRADPALAAIPAMLVTSRGSDADRRRGQEAGARAYIVKGEFDQDVFLNTVRGLVG